MLIKQRIKQYRILNNWFHSALGLVLTDEFCTQFKLFQEDLQGQTLLQLGHCGKNSWLPLLQFRHKWIASPFNLNSIQLECSFDQLPFDRNSVDCVLLPLTLEPFGADSSLLDEIDRVLKPMGFIVFLCINPWSFWGLAMKLGLLPCYDPHHIKMCSPFQMNRALIQRGYRQHTFNYFCYLPPVNNIDWLKKLTFLNEAGKMLWPLPSGLYCYIAQKYQYIEPNLLSEEVSEGYKSSLKPATNEL